MQNKLIPYSLIFILMIPLFGFNFLIGFLGNILLLIILIPLLLLGIGFLSINKFKSNINLCESCGTAVIGDNVNCPFCGYKMIKEIEKESNFSSDASKKTIEIKAEEIN